ncbi:hypothetical protein [Delftia sp. JD2]|uniref:hypothetical protein n=1 Tax=Delftia sp. JD2 TaxID=469553 RepID=UPI0011125490|nr:hypothetical protein [Delftia sp. JD2]
MNLENLENHELEEFQKQVNDERNKLYLFMLALEIAEDTSDLQHHFEVYQHHYIINSFEENINFLKSLELENISAIEFSSQLSSEIQRETSTRRKDSLENNLEIKHDKLDKKKKI